MVELPNWVWWVIILSPVWLTPIVSFPFVLRADERIGFWKSSAISIPAALPLILYAVATSFMGDILDSLGFFLVLCFGWISIGGPALVETTQWIYLESNRFLSKSEE